MFITKNQVLAAEVKKTFRDFKNAEVHLSEMHSDATDQPLPNRLQDLQEHDFPLFTTSRHMLCKLDASIGDPFFKREEDGSMSVIKSASYILALDFSLIISRIAELSFTLSLALAFAKHFEVFQTTLVKIYA